MSSNIERVKIEQSIAEKLVVETPVAEQVVSLPEPNDSTQSPTHDESEGTRADQNETNGGARTTASEDEAKTSTPDGRAEDDAKSTSSNAPKHTPAATVGGARTSHSLVNRRKKETARKKKAETQRKEDEENTYLADLALENEKVETRRKLTEVLQGAEKEAEVEAGLGPLYEVRPTENMGMKLFATRDIRGSREFLVEAPLIQNKSHNFLELHAKVATLSEEKRARFMALHGHCTCASEPCAETDVMKIWSVNNIDIEPVLMEGDSEQHRSHLYEIASRMNHACLPNAARGFTKDLHISFRAVRDIKKGEEITHDYSTAASVLRDFQVRSLALETAFHFKCRCEECLAERDYPLEGPYIIVQGFSLKEMQEFEAMKDGLECVGLSTDEELAKAAEVEQWLQEVTRKFCTIEMSFEQFCEHIRKMVEDEELDFDLRKAEFAKWIERHFLYHMENNMYNLPENDVKLCLGLGANDFMLNHLEEIYQTELTQIEIRKHEKAKSSDENAGQEEDGDLTEEEQSKAGKQKEKRKQRKAGKISRETEESQESKTQRGIKTPKEDEKSKVSDEPETSENPKTAKNRKNRKKAQLRMKALKAEVAEQRMKAKDSEQLKGKNDKGENDSENQEAAEKQGVVYQKPSVSSE